MTAQISLEALLRRLEALRQVRDSSDQEIKRNRNGPLALAWQYAKTGTEDGIRETEALLESHFVRRETFLKVYGKTHEELLTSNDRECRLMARAAQLVSKNAELLEGEDEILIKDPPCLECQDRILLKSLVPLLTPPPSIVENDEPPF